MNFGPHMLTFLESHRARLLAPKILWAKVEKPRRYGDGGENRKTPTFSKLMNFGPHISTLLESHQAGLQVTRILRTKVQKRLRYGDGAKNKNPQLSRNW